MSDELAYPNGIDADTGDYAVGPLTADAIVAAARGDPRTPGLVKLAKRLTDKHLGLPLKIRPDDVAAAGWGVVFHAGTPDEVRTALKPLIRHRAAADGATVHELEYRTGESRRDWLTRHRVAYGTVDPKKVPYYLLLVGSPVEIPFHFQYELDAEYSVGRLHFDGAAEYERYARSVVAYESKGEPVTPSAVFFGTRHEGDRATELSARHLVAPLAASCPEGSGAQVHIGPGATKDRLLSILATSPSFLFTATHGLCRRGDDPLLVDEQGALVCEGWRRKRPIERDHYLAAVDITENLDFHGLIALHFGCFGAGTPEEDEFVLSSGAERTSIAPEPFVARLPQRLLAHAAGGALAVIGHVERVWGYSYITKGARAQLQPFRNAVEAILSGLPVGLAMKDFNERYALLTIDLSGALERARDHEAFGAKESDPALAGIWMERNDARNYIVLGDPAARLRVA